MDIAIPAYPWNASEYPNTHDCSSPWSDRDSRLPQRSDDPNDRPPYSNACHHFHRSNTYLTNHRYWRHASLNQHCDARSHHTDHRPNVHSNGRRANAYSCSADANPHRPTPHPDTYHSAPSSNAHVGASTDRDSHTGSANANAHDPTPHPDTYRASDINANIAATDCDSNACSANANPYTHYDRNGFPDAYAHPDTHSSTVDLDSDPIRNT